MSTPLGVRARRWGAALLLCAAIGWVYRPGLSHTFVTDQIWYFAELDGSTSLADGLRHYDYAASRRYWKGDDILFRPLLFATLAVENSLLSYHHVWWNLVTVGLHTLIAFALYRLLRTIQPSPFAWLFAVLFAVTTAPVELALWNHLSGYLLAWLCLTVGLTAFVQLSRPDDHATRRRSTIAFVLAFGAGGFLHESMVPISLLAAALLLWIEHRGGVRVTIARASALLSPVISFAVLYVGVHMPRVQRLGYVDRSDGQGILALGNLLVIPEHTLVVWIRWLREMVLPAAVAYKAELIVRPTREFDFTWTDPLSAVNAIVAAGLLGMLLIAISFRTLRARWAIIACVLAAGMAYVAVISVGRPVWEVAGVSYYMYPACLLFATIAYTTVDVKRWAGARLKIAATLLVAAAAVHATAGRRATQDIGRVHEATSSYLSNVAHFVDAHKHEPGFTFGLRPRPTTVDPEIVLREGYPDDPAGRTVARRMTEILFRRYYDDVAPRYVPF